MDDSDQDFVDLCSRLLKRVRKKPGEPRPSRRAGQQPASQGCGGDEKRRKHGDSGGKLAATQPGGGAEQELDSGGPGGPGEPGGAGSAGSVAGPSASSSSAAAVAVEAPSEGDARAKDIVLLRMQQFKRANPQKMVHDDKARPINLNTCHLTAQDQGQKTSESHGSGPSTESLDNDEALALQLQQELDRETAEATVDLEDGGLFFCQICHRDLSHMTPEGRTQHLNRCLDENEESAPARPPPSGVPDCPICGKKFKSQKSRSSHLKRCSSDMGVSPAALLQALQRQAQENAATANTLIQTVSTKRKGSTNSGLPAKKKPRKKPEPLDEETAVALALSSSLLEQEKQQRREEMPRRLEMEPPALKWRPDAGKGRGKRKKAPIHRPPPLLLVQDPQEALARLQERVSALLLRSRPPSPSTPTRGPSTLSRWTGTAPLWQKSTLLDGGSVCASDFYTAELKQFFTPWEHVKTSLSTSSRPESSVQLVGEGTPVTGTKRLPSCSQTASCPSAPSTPGAGQLPVGSQALRDLMELAEDGMTLTQYGYSAKVQRLSGFIREESEEQDELCASGFLPETAHKPSAATHNQAARTDDQQGADKSVALSRLASDLSSMVNNPQLSDLQLQVDSGDVYFAHSFMVYARCPLLAEMVHESGFGVQEEGMPAAQRVLLNDVPGQAVLALLRYLYTAHSSAPASLQPHLLELASRFDLEELQQLCRLGREEAATVGDEVRYMNEEENDNNQTDQAFTDLLRSMWNEEDDDDTGISDGAGGSEGGLLEEDHAADEVTSGSREIHEEHVNEEELEEIYEFAATQKNKEERDSVEEDERLDDQQDGDTMFTKLSEPKRDLSEKTLHLDRQLEPEPSLNCGYTRLFSESWGDYEEGGPSSTSGPPKAGSPRAKQQQTPQKAPSQLCGRTVVQSSGSLPDDDLGAPPTASNFPIAGLSPHQGGDQGGCGDERENSVELDVSLNQERCSSHSISRSRDSPSKKEEPELIVLSDSSDEMEVTILSPCELSPPRPAARNLQSYTEIRSKQSPVSQVATLERKGSSSLELSPSGALDCSPEVSWLVPSTPVQAARSTRTSSTQTKSSIRRTQLFPKGETSPLFSSPALPVNASTSPHKVLACTGAPESSVSGRKLNGKLLSSSSLDVNVCPKVKCDESKVGEDCAGHLLQPKLSQLSSLVHQRSPRASSKQDTPLHLKTQPYSSTPLHAELRPPPPPAASLLHTHTDEQVWLRQQRETSSSESTEKPELGSFHLSPLSDPSDSGSGHLNKKRQSTSSSQSRASAESSVSTNTGVDRMRIEVRNEPEKREINPCEESMGDGEEPEGGNENVGEADVEESSFQQSFMAMDEPPIAFNDSWGLDICAEANPGCFSLRLEDSRGSSLQEPSPRRRETAGSSPPPTSKPLSSRHTVETIGGHAGVTAPSPPQGHSSPSSSLQTHKHPCSIPSPPGPVTRTSPETHNGLLDSKIWDSWEEDEGEALPLSQRVNPPARVRTPVSSHSKARRDLVPITPMPHYSDMDTPELKNKLNRFGVRPLPKRQMVLKLKEIHQYTHQLSSDSEDEASFPGGSARLNPPPSRPASCAQTGKFKEPRPPAASSLEEDAEPLSASQGSNTSSTAASDESERSNPELIVSSDGDSDSDGGISSSQVASRLQERLQAVRTFILSDPSLYSRILQYQPLVLSQLQQQLKAAGIRLGAAKLVDYLDSQCITFTTAKPGHSAPGRRGGKKTSKGARGGSRKKAASTRL